MLERRRLHRVSDLLLLVILGLLMIERDAAAQTTCRTSNCGPASAPPAACLNRSRARVVRIEMMGDLSGFSFSNVGPKIEAGGCIEWDSIAGSHSATDNSCPDVVACTAPPPPSCRFEIATIAAADPAVLCNYSTTTFPVGGSFGFYCRPHDSPANLGAMHGMLRITSQIALNVSRSGNDVRLAWTGGGVTGDETFKVAVCDNDPRCSTFALFPATGSTSGRNFTDAGEAANLTRSRYYLIRNKQPSEP